MTPDRHISKPFHDFRYTVLIAEDDMDDRLFVEEALATSAPHVKPVFVFDGQELIQYLQCCVSDHKPLPSLVIMDINMPRKNGREALAEMRSDKSFDQVPVVVFSTIRTSDIRDTVRSLGANDFISKPSNYSDYRGIFDNVSQRWLTA